MHALNVPCSAPSKRPYANVTRTTETDFPTMSMTPSGSPLIQLTWASIGLMVAGIVFLVVGSIIVAAVLIVWWRVRKNGGKPCTGQQMLLLHIS